MVGFELENHFHELDFAIQGLSAQQAGMDLVLDLVLEIGRSRRSTASKVIHSAVWAALHRRSVLSRFVRSNPATRVDLKDLPGLRTDDIPRTRGVPASQERTHAWIVSIRNDTDTIADDVHVVLRGRAGRSRNRGSSTNPKILGKTVPEGRGNQVDVVWEPLRSNRVKPLRLTSRPDTYRSRRRAPSGRSTENPSNRSMSRTTARTGEANWSVGRSNRSKLIFGDLPESAKVRRMRSPVPQSGLGIGEKLIVGDRVGVRAVRTPQEEVRAARGNGKVVSMERGRSACFSDGLTSIEIRRRST
jgi:hypothetical protein